MGNQPGMMPGMMPMYGALANTSKPTPAPIPTYVQHNTSYPGPYAVYDNCTIHQQLANVHDPQILSNYYGTSAYCAFDKLTAAKQYCNSKPSCSGITKVITSDGTYLPVTGGIPTLGGVTTNGAPNIFYHKIG